MSFTPTTGLSTARLRCVARRAAGSRFGLVLTLHDFSHVCATKRLMRMGSGCEGPHGRPLSHRALPPSMDLPLGPADRGRHGADAPVEEPGHRPRGLREQCRRQRQPYSTWPAHQRYP